MPSLSKVFSLILQDEKQRKVGATKKMQIDTAATLASVLATKNVKNAKKGRPQCTHCGAMGHVVDKCYKLHGYPPSYKFKSAKGQASLYHHLPTMLLLLKMMQVKVLALLSQNISSYLVY